MNFFKYIILFISFNAFSQVSNNLLTINSSSFTSNFLEYNTGEIFVVFNFGGVDYNKETNYEQQNNLVEGKTGIIVFPNPVESKLNYKIQDNFQFVNVKVFDCNQKLIFSSTEDTKQIDFSQFPLGLYHVIFNENPNNIFKIIKR